MTQPFSALSVRLQRIAGRKKRWVTLREWEHREIIDSRLYYAYLEIKPELKKLLSKDEPDLTVNLIVD